MAKQVINVGTSANDGTGDPNRTAFQKCNANFTELYDAIPTAQQYKFTLSQSGGDDPQTATSGTLTQGVTYEIVAFETGDDFIPSGAPNNTVGTKWIANGTAPTWSNGSELGWNGGAPIVGLIFGFDLSETWFEKVDTGNYKWKSNGKFPIDKVFFPTQCGFSTDDADVGTRFSLFLLDENTINLNTADSDGNFGDGYLSRCSIVAEIYP